jgi:hypothetical protein
MASQDRPTMVNKPTGAFAPVGIDRARRLAWWDVQRTDANQKLQPAADPLHSHWIHKLDHADRPIYLRGRVTDSIAYTNCHKVQFGMWGSMWCQMMTSTALQPIGVRQINQLPVGCGVIVLWYKDDNSGIIVGVIPDAQTNSKTAMVDFISQQARCGLLVDDAHNYPVTLDNAALITDWSAGRPFDSTTVGEGGNITETGLLDFIDSFMAVKRVDEECGLWTFWTDQLTRLAGHNLHIFSAGAEQEDIDDEGEFNKVEGHTPYYWEALSAFEFGLTVSQDIPAECWQKTPELQGLSATEPCDQHQLAFYRLRDFYGYWGQAHKRVVCLPPVECSSSVWPALFNLDATLVSSVGSDGCAMSSCVPQNLNLLKKKILYPGVFDEDLALTGRWAVRSAHEIIFSKHILIPAPKQMIRPEDPEGDNSGNYKAAGLDVFGRGSAHRVQGELDFPDTADDPCQIRAAGFLDTHAFVFNWIGEHPFHYHENDWWLPDEADLNYLARDCHTIAFKPPYFDELACHLLLQTPAAIPIKVDHRYQKVKYYPNHSYFGMLADGGVVIGDGYGAELKMANGSVWITAPGDVNLMAGRSVVSWAGYDLIMRAKNCWDISATNGSGRLKAQKNLWAITTGPCSGILLQCDAKGVYNDFKGKTGDKATLGGIVIKAEKSMIAYCASDMCFSLDQADTKEHVLTFDAGWKGRLKFKSKFFERFMSIDGAALDFWAVPGDCTGEVKRGAEYWYDGTLFCSPLVVNDKILAADCIATKKDLVALKGHVITSKAGKTQGKVGALVDGHDLLNKLNDYSARCKTTLPDIGETELEMLCKRQEKYCICDAEFSFRGVTEYATDDYVLFESRWQQLARVGGIDVNTWTEIPVNDTYPYPGKERLLGTTFRTLNPKLYNIQTGCG